MEALTPTRWLLAPLPRARVAALRLLVYAFVFVDLLWLRPWVWTHGDLPRGMYHPLFIARWLPEPTPTPLLVRAVGIALLLAALLAILSRAPRLFGALVFFLYLQWMLIAFSYGKVDHDRFAFLVALAVLPTAGPARLDDDRRDAESGWAVRSIQIAVVLTYVLAAFAKLRFGGGIDWLNGSVLARAIVRRGSFLADPLLEVPAVLVAAQYAIVAFELGSVLLLTSGRLARAYLVVALLFHFVVFAMLGIMFWPHLVALAAFIPLERLAATKPSSTRGRVLFAQSAL